MLEEKDVNASPSEAADVDVSSSETEQTQPQPETQTPPAKEGVNQVDEEPRIPYSRFKEVNDNNKLLQQLLLERQLANQQQPQTDPYAGLAPEDKVFYQELDKRAERIAEKIAKQKEERYEKEMGGLRQIIYGLMTKDFRRDFPDIKRGSLEEMEIGQKIQTGYPPEDAYKIVMFDKKLNEKQSVNQKQQQQQLNDKRKASPVLPNSVSPQGSSPRKMSFEEEIEQGMRNEWDGRL